MATMAKKVTGNEKIIKDELMLRAIERSIGTGEPVSPVMPPSTISVRRYSSSSCQPHEEVVVSKGSKNDAQDQTASTTSIRSAATSASSSSESQSTAQQDVDHDVFARNSEHKDNRDSQRCSDWNNSNLNSNNRRDSSTTLNSEEFNKILESTSTIESPMSTRRMMVDDSLHGGSQRFYLETADEECSIPSKVSILDDMEDDFEERSYGEWMSIVRTLYESLQLADSKLTVERQRRISREKNLVKLAKELSKRNDSNRNQKKVIEKVRYVLLCVFTCFDFLAKTPISYIIILSLFTVFQKLTGELVVERTEKSLLGHRLQHYVYAYGEDRADTREELEKELLEARKLHEATCADYEGRIKKINKSHGKQCGDICSEVIDTNRENIRLKQQLADHRDGGATTIRRRSRNARRSSSWKLRKNNGMPLRLLLAVFIFAGCAFFKSSGILARYGTASSHTPDIFLVEGANSSVVIPFRSEELMESSEIESTFTSNASDTMCVAPQTDFEVALSSESIQEVQETSNDEAPAKKSPLRKRTRAWLRKRVAKLGSRMKSRFVKTWGHEEQKVQGFLRARRVNGV
jgi:hypothetical protein